MAEKKSVFTEMVDPGWKDKYNRNTKLWNNKDEYTKVAELTERLDLLRRNVHMNNYFGRDGGMYLDSHDHWKYLTKIVDMWHRGVDDDDPRPNLKSTFAFNATETAMTELYDLNLMPGCVPWSKKGEKYYKVVENIIKYPILRYNFNDTWLDAFQEALWIGNSFLEIDYTKIIKTVKLKKLRDFSKADLKKMEEGQEIAIFQDKQIVQYNDVNWIHKSPFDYYPDNFAKTQHGVNFAAQDGITVDVMSYDAFRAMYDNRRGFVNVDKVKPGFYDGTYDNPIFRFPHNFDYEHNTIIYKWETLAKDITRYVANGVWIGDIPLPNHKQLSTIHIGCIKIPNQYYHMGLAQVIEGLQTEDEVIRNKFIELLDIALTPPIIANNSVAGEFKDQYESARYSAGEIISISGSPADIQWMAPAVTRLSEFLGFRKQIQEDVIAVSLINPSASAMPANDQTATETVALAQSTMKSFMKTLKSLSKGLKIGLKIQWAMQRQEYPLQMKPEDIEKRKGMEADDDSILKSREIFTKDVQIIDANSDITIVKKPGETFPFIIKDEYLDLDDDDVEVIINPESMQPLSKLSMIKKSEQALSQLWPIFLASRQDPGLLEDPRVVSLLKNYTRTHDLDDDILSTEGEDKDDQIARAQKQEALMYKNAKLPGGEQDKKFKPVLGIFDEPIAHRIQHARTLAAMQMMKEERMAKLEEINANAHGGVLEGQGMPPQEMVDAATGLNDEATWLDLFIDQLTIHLKMDKMTEDEGEDAVLSNQIGMQPGQSPVSMPGGMMGPGQPGIPPQGMMPPQGGPPMGGAPPGQQPQSVPGPTNTGVADMANMAL